MAENKQGLRTSPYHPGADNRPASLTEAFWASGFISIFLSLPCLPATSFMSLAGEAHVVAALGKLGRGGCSSHLMDTNLISSLQADL